MAIFCSIAAVVAASIAAIILIVVAVVGTHNASDRPAPSPHSMVIILMRAKSA